MPVTAGSHLILYRSECLEDTLGTAGTPGAGIHALGDHKGVNLHCQRNEQPR